MNSEDNTIKKYITSNGANLLRKCIADNIFINEQQDYELRPFNSEQCEIFLNSDEIKFLITVLSNNKEEEEALKLKIKRLFYEVYVDINKYIWILAKLNPSKRNSFWRSIAEHLAD